MARTLGRVPDHEFSSLLLNRPPPNMPPAIVGRDLPPANIIEISDDEDTDNDDHRNPVHLDYPAQPVPSRGPNPVPTSTMNVRLKPDTSPVTWRDSKRQKLDDAPEASGSRSKYPRARLEFQDADDGLTMAYPAFSDDPFVPNYRDLSPDSSPDAAARLLQKAALTQIRQPPYFFDAKLNIRMYCGPGYEQFPLPVEHDPNFQDACDIFDAFGWNDENEVVQKDCPVTVTQQDCLARILDIFPDIQHKFVLDKIRSQHELIQFPDEEIEMHPDSAAIIHEILEMDNFPKQVDAEEKPKDEFEEHLGKPIIWSRDHYQNSNYKKDVIALLASHFDHVPTHFINSTVMAKGNLFDAYLVIENIESDYFQGDRPYNRSKRPRVQLEKKYQTLDPQRDPPYYCSLVVEFQAAKQHCLRRKLESNQKQQIADAETANLEQHRLDGLLVQCKCCFDEEVPMNRIVVCTAKEEHPFCFDCVKRFAENQIGMKRYQMQCMDESKCEHNLDNNGIGKAIPIKTFDRLQFNQQQAEIKAANIEGLEQCPLCDFQAICDPPEIETIFSCQNPDCQKVTCRLCHEISHLPKTCEEVKKDRGLSARHRIEEARTNAMIRTCPSCQSAIIKSDGCNKMRCTCGSIICYACKADLSKLRDAYEHFDRGMSAGKKCPLYDDKTIDRHVQEANEAEEKAIQEAKAEDNTIEESTLRIETGKGKAVNRGGQGGSNRGINNLAGQMRNAGEDMVPNNFVRMLNEAGDGLRARRLGDLVYQRDREALWLQDLRQRVHQIPLPIIPGIELPQKPVQPGGLGGFGAPVAPYMHNPNQQVQYPLGNPFGMADREFGHGQRQTQGRPTQQFLGGPNFGFNNLQNQNQNDAYNYYQLPQPNNPDVINDDYMATAQRVHEARDQRERRRRSQIERRNTIHNEVELQGPNPEILNVRKSQSRNVPQPLPDQNNGLDNGARQHTQNYLPEAQRAPAADVVMSNTTENDQNGYKNNKEAATSYANYLRARHAFHSQDQGPAININQTQSLKVPRTRDLLSVAGKQNQNQNQSQTPTPGSALNKHNLEAAPRIQHHIPHQARPPAFGTQDHTQNQHQNRTRGWVFGQTGELPSWGNPPQNQNQNQTQGNTGVPGPVRPIRRQTMPLDGTNNAGNGFGNPNFAWARD